MDARIEEYGRLIVERSLDPQPGWQIWVKSTPLARPLVEEVVRRIARRGAFPLVRLSFADEHMPFQLLWASEAPESVLHEMPPIERFASEEIDAWVNIGAPENTREGADLSVELHKAIGEAWSPLMQRRLRFDIPWVTCRYPTPAMAQEAGMSLRAFEDFIYGACLLDWDAEGEKMRRVADRFDRADTVRIVGAETDLSFSVGGREGAVDDGHVNLPGGEVYYSPVEESTEGVVTYSEFPAVREPHVVEGVRMVFENGRVVDASAKSNEEALFEALDRDDGARRLGEFGIGCNPGIQRHMKNTLFDEKIYGTIHLAIGAGLPNVGGKNQSSMHWDMVKDLRSGGQIYCDGELVQENGQWQF